MNKIFHNGKIWSLTTLEYTCDDDMTSTVRHAYPQGAMSNWDFERGEYRDENLLAPLCIFTSNSIGDRKRYQGDDYMIVPVLTTDQPPQDNQSKP